LLPPKSVNDIDGALCHFRPPVTIARVANLIIQAFGLISSICARTIAATANIPELFRSADEPPLAELPFFVGC
jgi:hypothetical protein